MAMQQRPATPLCLLMLLVAGWQSTVARTAAEDISPLSKTHGNKNAMTLAFVFDSTNSMDEELEQVKDAMQEIFDYMRINHPEIVNYALVEFNDPEARMLSSTNDSHKYQESLDSIEIYDGEDCPEMAIEGIKIALEESLPNSYIFVFTDASAKDFNNAPIVQDLIQRKKSTVIFILTGRCINEDDEEENFLFEQGYEVYQNIAHNSNGYVFTLEKSEVNKVLEFIKLNTGKKEVLCVEDVEGARETGCIAPVDETIHKLTVTITGEDPRVLFEDPTGAEVTGNDTLHLSSALSSTIEDPMIGKWKIKVKVKSTGRFVVMADSSFSVVYGFSTNSTEDITETTQRPIAGINTSILIEATDYTYFVHLIDIKVKDSKYTVLETVALHPVKGKNSTYKSESFLPPNTTFFLEVYGKDSKNNSVTRISETAITPLPPGPPVTPPDIELIATLKHPFNLLCHVESLVPFSAIWHKGDIQISPVKHFGKSANFDYLIDNVTQSSEGMYTCRANNTIGNAMQSIYLHVKAPAPLVKTQYLIEIEVNKTGEIPCQVESDLNYTIYWTKRDKSGLKHIFNGAKFTIKPTGTLFIYSIQQSDEGEYNCSADSKSGKGENNTFVKVIEPVKVVITSNTKTFSNGASIQLNCSATGSSPISLVWQKNDTVLQNTDPRMKIYGENEITLNITNSHASDEGYYQCKGRNKFSTDLARVELVYLEPPSIKMKKALTPILVGTKYVLQCSATGSPKPTISWIKDGYELVPGTFEQILENGTLIIQKLSLNHTGEYECIAENEAGMDKVKEYIEIGDIPQFAKKKEEIRMKILQSKTLPCLVTGHPTPNITMSRTDGKPISGRFIFNGFCVIQLKGALPQDEGTYILTATNKHGSHKKELKINISGLEKPVLAPDSNEISMAGKLKELTCPLLKGNPPPTAKWYRNGKELDHINMLHLNAKHFTNRSLIIYHTKRENEGMYECRVTNIGGQDRRIVNLTVHSIPQIAGVSYTVMKVNGGESVELPCEIHGSPMPKITWKKDGTNINISLPNISFPKNNSLLISSTTLDSNGTYECIADNTVGKSQKKIDLLVQFSRPLVKTPNKTVELQYKQRGEIPCRVESKLNYTVIWTKREKSGFMVPVKGKNFTVQSTGTLLLPSVEKTDQGVYQCTAQSASGKSSGEIVVNVIEPVRVMVPFQKRKFKMHEEIELSCQASGSLPITLQWRKNGHTIKTVIPFNSSIWNLQQYR